MPVDRSHDVETDAERQRLRSLVQRLSDKELSRPMPGGWTVSAVFAHVAFWDARAIYFLDKWGPSGEPTTYEPEDTDAANDMLAKIRAKGNPPFNLSRAIHRKEHLDEIERELA